MSKRNCYHCCNTQYIYYKKFRDECKECSEFIGVDSIYCLCNNDGYYIKLNNNTYHNQLSLSIST